MDYVNVVVFNDEQTPHEYAVKALRQVFGKSEHEARQIASVTGSAGRCVCGSYPDAVARSLVATARQHADAAGFQLRFEVESLLPQPQQGKPHCSFCDKSVDAVRRLVSGKGAYICDACLIGAAGLLGSSLPEQQFRYVYELLDWHFAGCAPDELVTSRRDFPERMRADLQRAVESLFADTIKAVGVHGGNAFDGAGFSGVMERDRSARRVGPLQYQEIDIGEREPVRCLKNALWLLVEEGTRYAVLLSHSDGRYGQRGGVAIEICAPAGEVATQLAARCFRALEQAVNAAASYRGKVLSFEKEEMYSGMAPSIVVHRLPEVAREQIILPEHTLALLEKNVLQFARQRAALKKLGQSTKKGLLFYGPPGTGKTHTIRYLAGSLPGHTTLLVTAEQVAALPEYFTLARLLQPSIMVIEDADLIARHREEMRVPGEELLLNKLLNEMDGLRPEVEIFFILTTNRPETLEEALAARPGRIDQAVEFPLPDEDGRRKLVSLYAGATQVGGELCEQIVQRTEGVSAAFIKELMRRIAQYNIDRDGAGVISESDCSSAIEEMLFAGGKLSRALLGGGES